MYGKSFTLVSDKGIRKIPIGEAMMTSGELYGKPHVTRPHRNAADLSFMAERAEKAGVPLYMVEMYVDGDKKEAIRLMRNYLKVAGE
tara:strand:- start:1370 stop:1630 length:261 start_codon:yes stop_codon:yes gene_type:complete